MCNNIIHTQEHCTVSALSEEQLVHLSKQNNPLVAHIDFKKQIIETGYFIGLTWIVEQNDALYVKPKLDKIDYLKMLSICLEQPEMLKYGKDLFNIEFDKVTIKIKQQDDLITPLLIAYFLKIVQNIVKKGLKKGYYRVENNLHATVKGKILVAQTLKQNTFKNRNLNTICTYDEFGINYSENRIIKKALIFILRYLKMNTTVDSHFTSLLDYIMPAFKAVDENISINEVKKVKHNPFFSEYSTAIDVSILILKRFGFNINLIRKSEEIDIPPFWIDMPKLFEFYVLSKLKKVIPKDEIIFQANVKYGEIDFLRTTKNNEIVIDAKYKTLYKNTNEYDKDDIRQLSGYARDIGTFKKLQIPQQEWQTTVLHCLIIYPDQDLSDTIDIDNLLKIPINQFERFYKLGISIPVLS